MAVPVQLPALHTIPVAPIGGLVTSLPPTDIPDGASPDMLNLRIVDGMLTKRPGYTQLYSGNAALPSGVMGIFSARDTDGAWYLYAATTAKLYVYNAGTKSWTEVTGAGLNGTAGTPYSFAVSQGKLVFTQGVDDVQVADLNGATYAALNAGAVAARYIERFGDCLFLGHTLESASAKPFRTRWSVNGDHTDWSGEGSGFHETTAFPYAVQGIKKLVDKMAVYYEDAIEVSSLTGILPPFQFDLVIPDTGLYAPRTLAAYRDSHIFLGTDDFYLFNGSSLSAIGAAIRTAIFDNVNPNAPRSHFGLTIANKQEYLAFLNLGAGAAPTHVYIFNWGNGTWYPWTVSGPLCGCMHRVDGSLTIDELVGTIDEQLWQFNSPMLLSSSPALVTGHSDGKAYIWDSAYTSDNGAAILCRWTSKDFTSRILSSYEPVIGKEFTIRRIYFDYYDYGIAVTLSFSFSLDGGATWTDPVNVTIGGGAAGWKLAKVDRIVSGAKIRFKVENESATSRFTLGTFYLDAVAEEGQVRC